jgi:hypothetical protein
VADKLIFYALNKLSDQVMVGQTGGKLNHFLSLKDTLDVIVFGNSRANRHLDVSMMSERSFNIGTDGTDIAYFTTLIKTLPEKKEQLLIINIDTKNFFESDYTGSDIRALKTRFMRNEIITDELRASNHIKPLQNVFYSMNYTNRVLGLLKNYANPKYDYRTYSGYDPLVLSETQKSIRNIIVAEPNKRICYETLRVNPAALKYLKELKTHLEESGKTYVFITSPMYDDPCTNYQLKLTELMREKELKYWDFTNYFKNESDITLWKDKTHMTKKGAERFTKMLIDSLSIKN